MAVKIKRLPSGKIQVRGETYDGFNKPKRAPAGDEKKYVVLAKDGDKIRKVKFGQRGYEDYLQHKDAGRRANFKSRMNCDTAKDKLSARYWACRYNW